MDIQLMREFIALVNLKSYRKVAQQFHIAPSTLSRHIKAIGKELGHPLFENLRAYQLTDEGQVVFERFGILVGEYDGLLQAPCCTRAPLCSYRLLLRRPCHIPLRAGGKRKVRESPSPYSRQNNLSARQNYFCMLGKRRGGPLCYVCPTRC